MDLAQEKIYFDATLTPNRSLSPHAFTILMAIVGCTSFLAGLMFVSMGAFPVIGFFGLDALAIWLAFRINFRRLRQVTRIRVSVREIELTHEENGRLVREASVPTGFARIALHQPDRRPSELQIAHGASTWVVGRFLTPGERISLCRALSAAVARARAERYPA